MRKFAIFRCERSRNLYRGRSDDFTTIGTHGHDSLLKFYGIPCSAKRCWYLDSRVTRTPTGNPASRKFQRVRSCRKRMLEEKKKIRKRVVYFVDNFCPRATIHRIVFVDVKFHVCWYLSRCRYTGTKADHLLLECRENDLCNDVRLLGLVTIFYYVETINLISDLSDFTRA